MTTDKELSTLIINKLTQEQYDSATKSEDELYLITDAATSISDVTGLETALEGKQDVITYDSETATLIIS